MASKKYKLILALLGLISTASIAQRNDAGYNGVLDSSKVSTKNMPQHNEFMHNSYPYPPRPRDQWELGFGGGLTQIYGDVLQRAGYGGSITVRKAIGHILSLRAGYFGGMAYGIDRWPRTSYFQGPNATNPWKPYSDIGRRFSTSYKAQMHSLNLDAIISLNSLSFYRGNPKKMDWYVLAGYTALGTDVDVNALNGSHLWDFSGIDYRQSSTDIQKQISDLQKDDQGTKYESNAPVARGNREGVGRQKGNWIIRHAVSFGGGAALKLNDRFNIAIEQRFTNPFDDNQDGIVGGRGNDIITNTQARLNINIGNAATHVQPLWWLNPLNYAYNELNAPKHMKIPTPILPDGDGDGVTDQFDMEPNTPAGCPVDTHGVSLDTDGDGVPDCRDKEKLTPLNCFPVDADGVGRCPCPPDSCFPAPQPLPPTCPLSSLPSIQFKKGTAAISSTASAVLASVAQQLNSNPNCNVKVVGYGASDKRSQQLSWDHVNAVIKYLVEKQGISESRFLFTYGQMGDPNTVDLIPTTESGPNSVPAPFPNLRKTK